MWKDTSGKTQTHLERPSGCLELPKKQKNIMRRYLSLYPTVTIKVGLPVNKDITDIGLGLPYDGVQNCTTTCHPNVSNSHLFLSEKGNERS